MMILPTKNDQSKNLIIVDITAQRSYHEIPPNYIGLVCMRKLEGSVQVISDGDSDALCIECCEASDIVMFIKNATTFHFEFNTTESVSSTYLLLFPKELTKDIPINIPDKSETPINNQDILLLPETQYWLHSYLESILINTPHEGSMDWSGFTKIKFIELILLVQNESQQLNAFLDSLREPESQRIHDLIEKSINSSSSLQQLAHKGGYSVSTFKRKFRKLYNDSPAKYLNNRKMTEAYKMLKTSSMPVAQVGYELGYDHPSHFIKKFKDKYGATPKSIREYQDQAS